MFKTAKKNRTTALPANVPLMGTWGISTPHKLKNTHNSQKKSCQSITKILYYTHLIRHEFSWNVKSNRIITSKL